jgi:dTDP-4-amino-4,6-dideoxygalactose transaminase
MVDLPDALLLEHHDRCLAEHGDTAQGASWPDEAGRRARFDVMLDVLADAPAGRIVLCDLGCGTGELLARLRDRGLDGRVEYVGVDASARALAYARAKFPAARFHHLDVNDPAADLAAIDCDYLVANGLFTARAALPHAAMWEFLQRTVRRVWPHVRRGLAFNVNFRAQDPAHDDAFHAPMDDVAEFMRAVAGRRLRFRHDYDLHEYTVYATRPEPAAAPATTTRARVPAMRPLLATADRVLPYLRRIDAQRIYSNYGPLVQEFDVRLGTHFGTAPGTVTSASSGLAALVGAILGSVGRATAARPLAVVPSYTFIATATAVELCGFQPVLADVDADTWQLDPAQVRAAIDLERVGLVVPVAPYGRPVVQAPWQDFTRATGIPVVIDGAACFDTLAADVDAGGLGALPVALSFHATKTLGVGEGGAVVCTDAELLDRIGRALNFGFHSVRDCRAPNTNGKLSEYHAALGLAELDGWEGKREGFRGVATAYRSALAAEGIADRLVATPDIALNYVLFHADDAGHAQRACERLDAAGLEYRFWYGLGLHRQGYYAGTPHLPQPATDALAACLLGLPTAPDLDAGVAARAAAALAAATRP